MATILTLRKSAVYIIGVPSAGKTTLIAAIADRMKQEYPSLQVNVIPEAAREVIAEESIDREDIRAGTPAAMEMQYQILKRQFTKEVEAPIADLMLFDRSGIDPIVFSKMYGRPEHFGILLESAEWAYLRVRMRQALVILCGPLEERWLEDDGVRLLPKSPCEWDLLHHAFFELLLRERIPFITFATSAPNNEDRVQRVLDELLQKA